MEQNKKSQIPRNKILDAAEAQFAEKGLAAARVDEIALLAGVNKRMVYAHFENKENLYRTVLKIVYARIAKFEEAIEDMDFHGAETIKNVIHMYFDFLINNDSFVRLLLWENLEYARNIDETDYRLFKGIEKIINKGIKEGLIRSDVDVEQVVMSCNLFCFSAFSNVHTLSKLMRIDLTSDDELKKRSDHVADVISEYLIQK